MSYQLTITGAYTIMFQMWSSLVVLVVFNKNQSFLSSYHLVVVYFFIVMVGPL